MLLIHIAVGLFIGVICCGLFSYIFFMHKMNESIRILKYNTDQMRELRKKYGIYDFHTEEK